MKFTAGVLAVASASLAAATPATNAFGAPLAPRADEKLTYDGHHVYRVRAASHDDVHALEARFRDWPTAHGPDGVDLAVPPHEVRAFEALGLDARLLSEDLGKQIRAEAAGASSYRRRALHERAAGELPDLAWFDAYHDYADHLEYWDDLAAAFPDNSEKVYLGDSYEGREINAYHLFGAGEATEKPVILWHSVVHAREWISLAVTEYLAYQLIDGYKSGDANVTELLDHYDFWIVPFHNPDGFLYTQTNDRLWRKNRQPRSNTTCIGTDGNRNWPKFWYANPDGSSQDPCTQTYRGVCPGDTPEMQALVPLSRKLAAQGPGIRSFIDWHSYSQLVLTPWGWSCEPEDLPPTVDHMVAVAEGYAEAVEAVNGVEFEAGMGCAILYYTSGNSRDFHHGELGANHSWTVELRPSSPQDGGFVLPPEQILPSVKEQWAAQQWLLREVWDEE